MDSIKILWLRGDGSTRESYEMEASDLVEASRIFEAMALRLIGEVERKKEKPK